MMISDPPLLHIHALSAGFPEVRIHLSKFVRWGTFWQVLYAESNPGYIYFLYIVAPVNLVVLNPIAFVLMEFSRKQAGGKKFDCKAVGQVLKQVCARPADCICKHCVRAIDGD